MRKKEDLAAYIERIASEDAGRIAQTFFKERKAQGRRPIGYRVASERERLAEYLSNIDDADYFVTMLNNPVMGRTEEARRWRVHTYVQEMNKLYGKYRTELWGLENA